MRGMARPWRPVQTLYFNRARPGCAFARKAVLSESIDDLTVEYEENGQIILKELDKIVLSKGAWTTILFRYQEWKPQTSSYGPDKYVIRRYKKMGGEYRQQSKFTISSADQARKIVDALQTWIGEAEQEKEPGQSGPSQRCCLRKKGRCTCSALFVSIRDEKRTVGKGRSLMGRDAGEQSRPRGGRKETRQHAAGHKNMEEV